MKIALLAVPGSMKSALSGLSDMFWLANQVAEQNPALRHRDAVNEPGFSAQIVTADGHPVIDAQGRRIESEGSFESDKYSLIIASGMRLDEEKSPLCKAAITDAARWVKAQYQQGCAVAGACAGGFILAEAGLLNGRMCATTWWLYHTFRERYPLTKPVWGKALVEDRNIITTGGPLSWVDLAIHVVRLYAGDEMAKLTADMAVADSQPLSQHLYAPAGFLNSRHPLLIKAEHLVRFQDPSITVEQLAASLNMTTRTLNRKMTELTQESPKSFITRVRMETAAMLLENRGKTVSQVATECGYNDETAFRRAFNAVMGMSPGMYKEWVKNRSRDMRGEMTR